MRGLANCTQYDSLPSKALPLVLQVAQRFREVGCLQVPGLSSDGSIGAFLGVYDGHGGVATSDWLQKNLYDTVSAQWNVSTAEKSFDKAFREADSKLLAPGGWMGMGERGIGGSKCGSTAAVACVYQVLLPLSSCLHAPSHSDCH